VLCVLQPVAWIFLHTDFSFLACRLFDRSAFSCANILGSDGAMDHAECCHIVISFCKDNSHCESLVFVWHDRDWRAAFSELGAIDCCLLWCTYIGDVHLFCQSWI